MSYLVPPSPPGSRQSEQHMWGRPTGPSSGRDDCTHRHIGDHVAVTNTEKKFPPHCVHLTQQEEPYTNSQVPEVDNVTQVQALELRRHTW